MARRIRGAPPAAALAAALAVAPLAALAQPAENNDFEWRDFDLSGDVDPSNPYYAQPRLVAEGIDWSVFAHADPPTLAFEGRPMKPGRPPEVAFEGRPTKPESPKPDPSLSASGVDWSLYGVTGGEPPAAPDEPETLTVRVVEVTPEVIEATAEPEKPPSPKLMKADIDWSVFGGSGGTGDRASLDFDGEPMTPNPPSPSPKLAKGDIDWSVFGGSGGTGDRTSLDFDGEPMPSNPPSPKLVKADINWSVYD